MREFGRTEPMGMIPETSGRESGAGRRGGQGQGGRGRGGDGGRGSGGDCICPGCGRRIAHRQGIPCTQETCPECGAKMTRDM